MECFVSFQINPDKAGEENRSMMTVLLLIGSNIFMTFAWYGHLKFKSDQFPMWQMILGSWAIAFFEYCLQVPANRIGHEAGFSVLHLKIMQEVITLIVFVIFAHFVLKAEPPRWNHAVAFALILAAVYFAFLPVKKGI
jgi:uncharacterized protein